MATRKIRPGNRIAQMLLSGEPVSILDIREMFRNDPILAPTEYKISGYVGDIRKYDQGVVKVVKNGREVVSYQLLNHREFDDHGHRLTGEALTAVQAAMDPSQPIAATVNPYASHDVDPEVVTEEPAAAEVVVAEEPVASTDEVVTEPSTDEVPAEVVTEEAPATPRRNRGKFAKKAA